MTNDKPKRVKQALEQTFSEMNKLAYDQQHNRKSSITPMMELWDAFGKIMQELYADTYEEGLHDGEEQAYNAGYNAGKEHLIKTIEN